ncbi:MAG: GTPase/DUF3482 domain-containing protein [Kangiellaceae bacterium]|nr:GTPase/DUF3482 domain-containing protein [Kangiellaceae bacterium]
MKRATFAVVGHPNKGKSSIVSTLSQNDAIHISARSGTTEHANRYRVETENSGYQLVDTPGFQRPSKVLRWLKNNADGAHLRAQAVRQFVESPECQASFPDEVELLQPIVNGAAILYVVDGSRPYGIEYEAEMEILQWTGQPSMALINPIENNEYVQQWQDALAQFFKTVRVFNPMTADFEKQTSLLQTFAHLNPDWDGLLNLVVSDLVQQKESKRHVSAIILARLVEDLCCYQVKQKLLAEEQAEAIKPVLEKRYQNWIEQREQRALNELLTNYSHHQLDLEFDQITIPHNLFDQQQWYMWGLDKKQLAVAATVAGATAGAMLDAAVAGHSFMLGAIGGGVAGFSSAWFGADKITEAKFKGLPLGGYEAVIGPIQNRNFPYVIIGRFIYFYDQISRRNHANRDKVIIETGQLQAKIDKLEKSTQKELHQACERLAKQKSVQGLENILVALL